FQVVNFRPESEVAWGISEASRVALIQQLKGNSSINFIVAVEFSRPYDEKKKEVQKHATQWSIEFKGDDKQRKEWVTILESQGGQTISLPQAFPSYLLVPNEGAVTIPTPLVSAIQYNQDNYQRPQNASDRDWFDTVKLSLVQAPAGDVWVAQTEHPPQYTNVYFNASNITYGNDTRTYVQTIAFVDKAFPSFFAKYLQGG
ncbi:hypothetical protein COOONC_17784, partial [Cooperia oncophora]